MTEQQLGAGSAVCWGAEVHPHNFWFVPASATWQQQASGGVVGTRDDTALPLAQGFQMDL